MTKRELWLKLFSENDSALATAIHLCERFGNPENLTESGREFLLEKRRELDEEVSPQIVAEIFPELRNEGEHGYWIRFWCQARGLRFACSCCAVSEAEKLDTCPNCGATMDLPEREE